MSYYRLLGFLKEPFSTSPDPAFFYESEQYHSVLTHLLIQIRLRRGLSVVLGDVGTGKTTLSRKVFQKIRERGDIVSHMILDPSYESEEIFLDALMRTFEIEKEQGSSILDYKDAIKRYLFRLGVEENKTVVLLVDEAQKMSQLSLEILRGLLNYETNEYKLIQIVLLAQMELLPRLREVRNLMDRISFKYALKPLNEEETRQMIAFRLAAAGAHPGHQYFTDEAIGEIHRFTQGYPRRIAMLCHDAMKALVVDRKSVVNEEIIRGFVAAEVR